MMINQEFARKFFPNEDPIGKRLKIGAGEGAARESFKTRQIIGVVGNLRRSDIAKTPVAAYFVPLSNLCGARRLWQFGRRETRMRSFVKFARCSPPWIRIRPYTTYAP